MLLKGFALLLLVLIPVLVFSSKKYSSAPKIIYLTPTPSSTGQPTVSPTSAPASPFPTDDVPTATPVVSTRQITPPSSSGDITAFMYPGAAMQSQDTSSLSLTSHDDAAQITNWYKNKIQQLGMNTTSFITTTTNGNVSNKLVAANGSRQIAVNISKSAGNSQVTISVAFSG